MRGRRFTSRSGGLAPLILALAVAACGGTGPAAPRTPSVPAPTPTPTLVVRDGVTEEIVAPEVAPPAPVVGMPVMLRAPGYLVREQRWDGSPIFLWPNEDINYVSEVVYNWEFQDGTRRLVRWDRPFTVTLDGDLAEDAAVMQKAQEVVTELSRTSGLPILVGPGGACMVTINPSLAADNIVGLARLTFRGPTIIGGTVEFVNRREIPGGPKANYSNTLLHEMGHIMGLQHSPSTRDVMTPGRGPGTREATFQPNEALCLHMMYRRRTAGNIFPDRESALGVAAADVVREVVIVD